MDNPSLSDIVVKMKEYGQIYRNVKSDHTKEQLLHSAPDEVLQAYTIVAKNILIANICLSRKEHDQLSPYKETMKKLGFKKCSSKVKRRLLSEGDIFLLLSKIMSQMTT